MQAIEINTTQNVIINYELAPLQQRIGAFLIDGLIICSSIFILLVISIIIFGEESANYSLLILGCPIFFFYSLLFEIFNEGQSWGKKALNIKVVKLDGKEPQLIDYLLRWVFRMIDIYLSLGIFAVMLIGSSSKNQRLGDLLANTTIIQMKPSVNLQLSDILQLNNLSAYTPKYPEVKNLSEEDMILIKTALDRAVRYSNKAHQEALELLAYNIQKRLNLKENAMSHHLFLTTLIKDYIVLTR